MNASFALVALVACGTTEAPSPRPPPAQAPTVSETMPAPVSREAWTEEVRVSSAPFDAPGAPSALVHASAAFDPTRPLRLVVFLHGWSGCARMLMLPGRAACHDRDDPREGWDLAGRFDASGSDALFLVVQLAMMARDGSAGRFEEEGRFRAFLTDTLRALRGRIGEVELADVESIALLAHSAGYESALAVLAHGGVEIDRVVLFDALYRGVEPFLAWAAGDPDRRLVSLYTGEGRTARQSAMLGARAVSVLGQGSTATDAPSSLVEQVRTFRVVVARSPVPHGSVPARHIPELLEPLGLGGRE